MKFLPDFISFVKGLIRKSYRMPGRISVGFAAVFFIFFMIQRPHNRREGSEFKQINCKIERIDCYAGL